MVEETTDWTPHSASNRGYSDNFLIYQLEPEEMLYNVMMRLKGYKKDDYGEWKHHKELRMLTDEQVNEIHALVEPAMTKQVILSQAKEHAINHLVGDIWMQIVEKCILWSVPKHIGMTVRSMVVNMVYFNLQRSFKGKTLDLIGKTVSRHETETIEKEEGENKKGWLPKVFGDR